MLLRLKLLQQQQQRCLLLLLLFLSVVSAVCCSSSGSSNWSVSWGVLARGDSLHRLASVLAAPDPHTAAAASAAGAAAAARAATAAACRNASLSFLKSPRFHASLKGPARLALTSLYSEGGAPKPGREKEGFPARRGPRVEAVLQQLQQLTLLEASELVRRLEEVFGISAGAAGFAAPAATAAAGGAPPGAGEGAAAGKEKEAPKPEKTEFDLVLKSVPTASRITTIKTLRTIRKDLGLKEAKDFIDSLPQKVLSKVNKQEAEKALEALKAAGAELQLE